MYRILFVFVVFSSPSFVALAKTLSTVLKRSGEPGCRYVLMYMHAYAYIYKHVCVCTYVLFKCLNICLTHLCGKCAYGYTACGALSLPSAYLIKTFPTCLTCPHSFALLGVGGSFSLVRQIGGII